MAITKLWTWGAAGLACAACCAPLLAPLVIGGGVSAGAGAWFAGVPWEALLCATPLVLAVWWVLAQRRKAKTCDCENECGPECRPNA